jgi:hypothetical protein
MESILKHGVKCCWRRRRCLAASPVIIFIEPFLRFAFGYHEVWKAGADAQIAPEKNFQTPPSTRETSPSSFLQYEFIVAIFRGS